jgi:prolyl-tRNA synthetase
MKLSRSFWQTYKEAPADAEIISHQLMIRAGLIHKNGAGLYNYLPFGLRAIKKVEKIVREEMDRIDCQEILMTMVTPGELWQESGRWDKMGGLMARFKDKSNRDICLSPTNEETVTDIFRKSVKSYKQLPVALYQINTKFRDEIRPRFGLMRAREFSMKDAYSFHSDKACLDKFYDAMYGAYENVFNRLGLKFIPVEADGGAMATSDSKTHEFQVIADSGEDTIIYCEATRYAANIEKAQTKRNTLDFKKSTDVMKEILTPGKSTINDVCAMLNIPQYQSLKALAYKAITGEKEQIVIMFLLGDDNLNEVKVIGATKADHVKMLSESELSQYGLVKGYMGPFNIDSKIEIYFDHCIDLNASYVVGAQKVDTHMQNFIPSRDTKNAKHVDLRMANAGDLTVDGKGVVEIKKGIEVGHIFQLGDKYTKALSVTVLDQNGKTATPIMGCYGIGVSRVVAAAIEQQHDQDGIIWPISIAPYQVYFVTIAKAPETSILAEEIYQELMAAGIEVVYDDRKVGPGFKFKDADLLGIPVQLVLGERDFLADGTLELKTRNKKVNLKIKRNDILAEVKKVIKELGGK